MSALAESLRQLLTAVDTDDFERAAVEWTGELMAEHPSMGIDQARRLLFEVQALGGARREVARARLSLILRGVGEIDAAKVVERA